MTVALLALMLILPVSALAVRRLPFGSMLKLFLIWAGIFAALFFAIAFWRDGLPR